MFRFCRFTSLMSIYRTLFCQGIIYVAFKQYTKKEFKKTINILLRISGLFWPLIRKDVWKNKIKINSVIILGFEEDYFFCIRVGQRYLKESAKESFGWKYLDPRWSSGPVQNWLFNDQFNPNLPRNAPIKLCGICELCGE